MGVMEVLYLLFKTNAKEASKDMDTMSKETDKTARSLDAAGRAASGLNNYFTSTVRELAGIAGGMIAVSSILNQFTKATDYALNVSRASQVLGVNVQQLDEWGNAVQRTGGTAEGFQASLRSLAQNLGTTPAMAMRILPQLASTFERLGRFNSMRYGRMLGLDDSTILLLQQGRREVEAIIAKQRELGVITEHDKEESIKFNNSVTDLSHAFRGLFTALAMDLLPPLTRVFDAITPVVEYLRAHTNLIVGSLYAIGAAAAVMLAPFIILNSEIILIAAGIALLIAAFAILYEDVQAFREGHSSFIGDVINRFPMAAAAVKALGFEFNLLVHPIQTVIDLVKELVGLFGTGIGKGIDFTIEEGKKLLSFAGVTPLNSQTPGSMIGDTTNSRSNNVTVGDVTIQTQATDADGIAASFRDTLSQHFWQVNNNYANGVEI